MTQLPELLNSTNPDQVLRIDKAGKVFLGGRIIADADKEIIAREAKTLENSKLWKVMLATLEADANERITLKSTTWEDVWAGKMQLYNLSIMKKVIVLAKTFAKPEK